MKSHHRVNHRFLTCRSATRPFFILHFSLFILFAAAACNKPRIIPDDKLSQIFHDVYLTNSYHNRYPRLLDSLNIYEPVFASYGYTSEDIQYTIGSFAKRKSARLSDIVDAAIAQLGRESSFYRYRLFVRDTVSTIAGEKYARVVRQDSVIRVRRVRDTSRLRIVIPVETGRYEVSYRYLIDSAELNEPPRVEHYLVDTMGREISSGSRRLRQLAEEETITASFNADDRHRRLVLNLNGYPEKDMKRPSLVIRDLIVKYYIPDSVALARLTADMLRLPGIDSIMSPLNTVPPRLWPRPEDFVKPASEGAEGSGETAEAADYVTVTEPSDGVAGSNSGADPGRAGSNSGADPGRAGSNSGADPGRAGGAR